MPASSQSFVFNDFYSQGWGKLFEGRSGCRCAELRQAVTINCSMLGEVDARRRNQRDAVNGYAGECGNLTVVVIARHERRRRGKEMTRANGRTVGQAQQFVPTHVPSIPL